jgi:nitroreductase
MEEGKRMNVLDVIRARASYRGRFQSTPVSRNDLKTIMEAGLAAPSGCNKQTVSLIAVDDPVLLKCLKSVIDPPICETAPAMICVLTQRIIAYRDRSFYVQDYAAAIENMLLAAMGLGIASCWIEGHITDEDRIGRKMADILNVPSDYELVCFLPLGYADEEGRRVSKKAFDERAWFNGMGLHE